MESATFSPQTLLQSWNQAKITQNWYKLGKLNTSYPPRQNDLAETVT